MVEPTKRDRVWRAALEVAAKAELDETEDLSGRLGSPEFGFEDVKAKLDADVADRTIRDCLMAMVELDVLKVQTSRPHKYRFAKEVELDDETIAILARL